MPHGGFALRSIRVIAASALVFAPSALVSGASFSEGQNATSAAPPSSGELPPLCDADSLAEQLGSRSSPTPSVEPSGISDSPSSPADVEPIASPSPEDASATPSIRSLEEFEQPTSEPSPSPTAFPSESTAPSPDASPTPSPTADPLPTDSPAPSESPSIAPTSTPESLTTVVGCPVTPTRVSASPGVNQVLLTWMAGDLPTPNGDGPLPYADPDSYLIKVVGGESERVVAAASTEVTVLGLRNGLRYAFQVFAVTDGGRSEGSEVVWATPSTGVEGVVAGLIVEFATDVEAGQTNVPGEARLGENPDLPAVELTVTEKVTDDAVLVELDEPVDLATAERLAEELAADDRVVWAEPDQFFFTANTQQNPPIAQPVSVPTDTRYAADQWNLWDFYGVSVGDTPTRMTDAWAGPRGKGVTVAVIDTGITAHPDLDAQLVSGYDFVSNPEQLSSSRQVNAPPVDFDADYADTARFGDLGRDANPADPGDWSEVAPARDSSWHGTKMAGLIAAQADTGGITGIAPEARIQPVRALSWRGGLLSDIAASITWASGGTVTGVPANANPSKVINMSFAVETICPLALQDAIDAARARGSILIAAAGNANDDAAKFAPGNCNGVITVAATNRDGLRADYSNYGSTIDVSAPGGDAAHPVVSTSNTGTRAPAEALTGTDYGTSVAAAHVTAAAAILASRNATLTPEEAFTLLTGKDFTKDFANPTCDTNPDITCGTGILSLAKIASGASGDQDYAMNFNGTSQYATAPDDTAFDVTGAITIEAWVKPTSTCPTSTCMVVNKEEAYQLYAHNGKWGYSLRGETAGWTIINTGLTPRVNQWQHLAFTRAAGANEVNFYVDGQLVYTGNADGAGTGTIANTTHPFTVGARSWNTTPYPYQAFFPGVIDEVRLFSGVRTEAQIVADMHTYGPTSTTNLVAYYDFNEGATGPVYNRASGATSATNLATWGSPTYTDVKETTSNGSNTVVTFPRSYLTAAGGWRVPAGVSSVDYLLVGAGGGGGTDGGSGGGGGSLRFFTAFSVTSEEVLGVSVGAGGRPGVRGSGSPSSGQSSSLVRSTTTYSAPGGSSGVDGPNGGAGGAGGTGGGSTSPGGSGGTAARSSDPLGTAGSDGPVSDITGSRLNYGGGGGGGVFPNDPTTQRGPLAGGAGGGGAGAGGTDDRETSAAESGVVNTGGGGGGARADSDGTPPTGPGGWGGSGVVIVRYATPVTATWTPPASPNGNFSQTFTLQLSVGASGIDASDFSNSASSGAATGCVFSPASPSIAANTNLTVTVYGCSAGNLKAQVSGSGITFTTPGTLADTSSSQVVITSAGTTPSYPTISGPSSASGNQSTSVSLGAFALDSSSCTVGQVKATVSAAAGTLTATARGSASVSGNATSTLTISGTVADVDVTLDSVELLSTSAGSVTVTTTLVPAANSTVGGRTYLFNPSNGHYYLVTAASSTTWLQAASNAYSETFCGAGGYPATITSSSENEFISQQALTTNIGDLWIGGQKNTSWKWYPGPNGPTSEAALAAYAQSGRPPWQAGEPNNSGDDLQIYFTGGTYGWDDTQNARNQRALVEFGNNTSFTAPSTSTVVTFVSPGGGGGGGGTSEPTPSPSVTSSPSSTPSPAASVSPTATATPLAVPTLSPSPAVTPRPTRATPTTPESAAGATAEETRPTPTASTLVVEEETVVVEESPRPGLSPSVSALAPTPTSQETASAASPTDSATPEAVPTATFDAQPPPGQSLLTDTTPIGPVMNLRVDLQIGASVEGRSAVVEAAGLMPGSDVQVLLYSEPMVIGTGVADGAGNASIATQIPGGLPPGQHTIMAVGTGPSGDPVQSVGAFEITADDVVTRFVEPAQILEPIDPEDPQIARALEAGKPLYDVALYPAVIATVAVAGAAVVGLAGAGGLTGTGSASGGRSSRGKLAGVVTKKLKALKAPDPGLGDRSRSWAMPGTRRTDSWIKELPKRAGRISALLPRVLVDGAWSRAMFGSFGFVLWGIGLALGLWSAWSTGFEALPPALPLMLAIIALGILDAAAGAIAWLTIVVGALVTGNLTTWPEIRTALGLFVIFASIPLLAHVIRPLRRRISGTGMELFDRVADYVMPPIFLAFAAASMFKALNGLSGLELVSKEDFGEVRIVVIVAFLMRMAMEDVATYAYPVRSAEVQPEKLVSPGKGLALLSVAIRVGVFLIIAEPFFGLGWATYLSALLIAIPMVLKVYEDNLPNLVWLNKWYPRGVANFAMLLVVGIYVSFWLLGQDATDEQVRQTYNFILLPGIVSGLIQLVGREGGVWPENWWKRAIGFVVWLFAVGIVTGVIALT